MGQEEESPFHPLQGQEAQWLSKFHYKKLVLREGAWTSGGYHISKRFTPDYEKALVDYLKGTVKHSH